MPSRILFVTPYVPSRLRTRPFGFVRTLAERGHRVTLVSAASTAEEENAAAALRPWCEKVRVVRVSLARSLWNCARGLGGRVPLQALYSQSPALDEAVRDEVGSGGFDLLHVEHLRAARLGLAAGGSLPRVFDAVDCITGLFEQAARDADSLASRWRARLDLGRTRRYEGWLWRQFDGALVTSEADRARLLELPGVGVGGEQTLKVVPNGVDVDYFSPGTAPRSEAEIVFVGRMGYHANVAAAVRLVEEIMPLVWAERPEAEVTIVGADPTARVAALPRRFPRVTVTGEVDDVRPYLRRAALAACPLVYAAGIQNKILEAMACATPVVTSTPAVRALSGRPGEALLAADGSAGFASEILRILDGREFSARLGEAGRAYVRAEHDWNSVVARLEELYQGALARFGVQGQR